MSDDVDSEATSTARLSRSSVGSIREIPRVFETRRHARGRHGGRRVLGGHSGVRSGDRIKFGSVDVEVGDVGSKGTCARRRVEVGRKGQVRGDESGAAAIV